MVDYNKLKNQIEIEYRNVVARKTDTNHLCELLTDYIRKTIENTIRLGNYLDKDAVEDLLQDTLLNILEKGLFQYKDNGKSFAGYCCVIAKNKARDYVCRRRRELISQIPVFSDSNYEEEEQMEFYRYHQSEAEYRSAETNLLLKEHQLECIDALMKYILLFLNQKDKPYRSLGNCYCILLFKLINTTTKELSSPSWAFDQMKERTLQKSSDHFMAEIRQRIRMKQLSWGADFLDGMEEEENDILICDIIFGERFTQKDLENWSLRFRNKLRVQLIEELMY